MVQNIRYGNCFVFNDDHSLKGSVRPTFRTGSQYGEAKCQHLHTHTYDYSYEEFVFKIQ